MLSQRTKFIDKLSRDEPAYKLAKHLHECGQLENALKTVLPAAQTPTANPGMIWFAAHLSTLLWRYNIALPLYELVSDQTSASIPPLEIDLAAAQEATGDIVGAYKTLCKCAEKTGDSRAEAAAAWIELRVHEKRDRADKLIRTTIAQGTPHKFPNIQTYLNILDKKWNKAHKNAALMFQSPYICKESPPSHKVEQNNISPLNAHNKTKAPSFTLATSLSPYGGDEQKKAVDTWRATACTIISVNTKAEIDILQKEYPYVNFIETLRNGKSLINKSLIFIDDILSALEKTTTDLCAIVNGDILLLNADDLIKELSQANSNCLTLYNRIELETFDANEGKVYKNGFDAFFFPRSHIHHFKGSDMLLGAPWWDYFFPIIALQRDISLHIPQIPTIGHVLHPINWSREMHLGMAQLWIQNIQTKDSHRTEANEAYCKFAAPTFQSLAQLFPIGQAPLETAAKDQGDLLDIISNLATITALFIHSQASIPAA